MIEPSPAHPFTWAPQPWGRALVSSPLAQVARHLFTTRDLALRGSGEEDGWAHLAIATGVRPDRLVRLKQVHGVDVFVIRASNRRRNERGAPSIGDARPRAKVDSPVTRIEARGERLSENEWPHADIVMTDDPTVALAVQAADCVPLLLADPATGAVAAVHAGWRGTAAGIAGVAVAAMTAHFNVRPGDLVAAVGPSIGVCCYRVGGDVIDAFRAAGFAEKVLRDWFQPDDAAQGRYRLDLPKAIVDQLRAAGVAPANMAACGLCTACHPSLFPSYRRDGPRTGRIAGAVRGVVRNR